MLYSESIDWMRQHKFLPYMTVAGIPFPYSLENKAMYIQGAAGTGKSQVFKQMIYDLRQRGGRDKFVIYDRKPEYVNTFFRNGDKIISPADKRHTRWDLFREIHNEQHIDDVTASLIPESADPAQKFWISSARQAFKATLVYLMNMQERESKKCNEAIKRGEKLSPLPDLSHYDLAKFLFGFTTSPDAFGEELLKDPAAVMLSGIIGAAAKENEGQPMNQRRPNPTVQSVLGTLKTYTDAFARPETSTRGDFSLKDWLWDTTGETDGQALFLVNPANFANTYRSYFTVAIDILLREMISLPNDNERRIWFFLDEFGSLAKLDTIIRLLAEGRSKGAGTVIGTQDKAQIEESYNKQVGTLVNNCNSKVFAKVNDPKEAEFVSELIGDMELEKKEDPVSASFGEKEGVKLNLKGGSGSGRRDKRRAIMASEVTKLPDLNYICQFGAHMPVRTSIPYYPWWKHEIVPAFIKKADSEFDTRGLFRYVPNCLDLVPPIMETMMKKEEKIMKRLIASDNMLIDNRDSDLLEQEFERDDDDEEEIEDDDDDNFDDN